MLSRRSPASLALGPKVFWFFFSKKEHFFLAVDDDRRTMKVWWQTTAACGYCDVRHGGGRYAVCRAGLAQGRVRLDGGFGRGLAARSA
jgi:hypothetical protein